MAGKIKFHLNPGMIRARMKEMRYTYKDIEEKSDGLITETMLKHFMNKGNMADEDTISVLADILIMAANDFIEPGELLSMNIPFEITRLTRGLYVRMREDIQPVYAEQIKHFKEKASFEKLLEIAHCLLIQFTEDDLLLNKDSVKKIFSEIINNDSWFKCLCNPELTEITFTTANELHSQFIAVAKKEYNPHYLFLIFVYIFILFDAVFLAECIASAYQLMPQRKNGKADQYYDLTKRSDDMRRTLIKSSVYMKFDSVFNGMTIEEAGLDDEILNVIMLMLSACETCLEHQKSPYHKSEYVNRTSLGAVLSKLENVFLNIGLPIETSPWTEMPNSRFGKYYFCFQALTRTSRPKQKNNGYDNNWVLPYLVGKYSN